MGWKEPVYVAKIASAPTGLLRERDTDRGRQGLHQRRVQGLRGYVGACPNQAITITVPDLDAVDATFKRIEEAVDVK